MSLDSLDSKSGSPYSHGKHWRRRNKRGKEEDDDFNLENRYSRPINIVNYNRQESGEMHTSPGSPYQIRKPVALWVEQQQRHNTDEEWKSSQESELNFEQKHDRGDNNASNKARRRNIDQSDRRVGDGAIYHPQEEQVQFPIVYQSTRNLNQSRQRRNSELHRTRGFKSKSKRVINKKGNLNVLLVNLPQKSLRFVKDLVTTLVDVRWRYLLLAFGLSFFGSWILFATLWFLIAYAHGDLDFDPETGERLGDGDQPCVLNAKSFAGFLLFSIETQVTTGFGDKVPTEECPEAIFLLIVQIIVGLVIEGGMVGIVYAKLIRPPKPHPRDKRFSRVAVVCQRDGKLCFIFRVCDLKFHHAIGTKVTAVMLEQRRSLEGELIEKYESSMKLENKGRILLFWPLTVCHVIDCDSPLFDISAKDLLEKRFEIVVTISGGNKTTGQVSEASTSYLPGEIYWGHRFQNMIHYDGANEHFVVSGQHLDATEPVDTPLCSARRLEEVLEEVQHFMENDRVREFDGMDDDAASDSDHGLQIKELRIALEKEFKSSNQSMGKTVLDEPSNDITEEKELENCNKN
ncbi:ATP-sensitive inward rectifier potassium channel 11-like isoform X1 [Culex pipiens pallens]|uniref:ATP-sensitive inward rectifier potassium channel 11-like isoform X1 n=1 Tax=Culex pipiens pallens TaxID=42434 RepID=UPI001954A683|nr:ATP-sensitive inward rectifier potassium channel 11-like isoform X1 [Culex pipiens pallens]